MSIKEGTRLAGHLTKVEWAVMEEQVWIEALQAGCLERQKKVGWRGGGVCKYFRSYLGFCWEIYKMG